MLGLQEHNTCTKSKACSNFQVSQFVPALVAGNADYPLVSGLYLFALEVDVWEHYVPFYLDQIADYLLG